MLCPTARAPSAARHATRLPRAISFCWSNSRAAARQLFRAHLRDVVVVELPGRVLAPAQRRLHRGARAGGASSRRSASSSVSACESTSCGLPAELPSGKSLNRKRGTAACSTMSLAQPITTVGMPFASRWRATSAVVWWQTGQFGTSTATSTLSARQRARISGASVSMVTRWLRLVGAPKKRGATSPIRPAPAPSEAAAAETRCRCRSPWCACGRSRYARCADRAAPRCRRHRPCRTWRRHYRPRRDPDRPWRDR